MSVFNSLLTISSRTKTVMLADPADILASIPRWSHEQQRLPEQARGYPADGYRLELAPEAVTTTVVIRRLTSAERETCDRMLEAVMPPEIIEDRPSAVRGEPPQRVRTGFDDEAPSYLAERRKAESKQQALVCLFGVEGLMESTEGTSHEEKISALRGKLDELLIKYLAGEIWNRTYSAGDAADFFTKANSAATPS